MAPMATTSTTTPELLEARAQALRVAMASQAELLVLEASALDGRARRTRAMRSAYLAGVSLPEIARALGLSTEAVSKALGRPRRAR